MANEGFVFPNGIPRIRRRPVRNGREYLERQLEERPETAEIARGKLLTREEKARKAIDCMTMHETNDQRKLGNGLPNEEATRAKMAQVAERCENRKDSK